MFLLTMKQHVYSILKRKESCWTQICELKRGGKGGSRWLHREVKSSLVVAPCCCRVVGVSSVKPGMSELRRIRLPLRSSSHAYSFPLPRFPLWVPDTFFPFTVSQPFLLLQRMNVFNTADRKAHV